jgi:hypothetical protein
VPTFFESTKLTSAITISLQQVTQAQHVLLSDLARLLFILAAGFGDFFLPLSRQKFLRGNGSRRMLPPHITMKRTTSAHAGILPRPARALNLLR